MDYRDLHKNAKRIGLDRLHLEAWRDYWGPALAPAWKHHLRRLDDDLGVAGRGVHRPSGAAGIHIIIHLAPYLRT